MPHGTVHEEETGQQTFNENLFDSKQGDCKNPLGQILSSEEEINPLQHWAS